MSSRSAGESLRVVFRTTGMNGQARTSGPLGLAPGSASLASPTSSAVATLISPYDIDAVVRRISIADVNVGSTATKVNLNTRKPDLLRTLFSHQPTTTRRIPKLDSRGCSQTIIRFHPKALPHRQQTTLWPRPTRARSGARQGTSGERHRTHVVQLSDHRRFARTIRRA